MKIRHDGFLLAILAIFSFSVKYYFSSCQSFLRGRQEQVLAGRKIVARNREKRGGRKESSTPMWKASTYEHPCSGRPWPGVRVWIEYRLIYIHRNRRAAFSMAWNSQQQSSSVLSSGCIFAASKKKKERKKERKKTDSLPVSFDENAPRKCSSSTSVSNFLSF